MLTDHAAQSSEGAGPEAAFGRALARFGHGTLRPGQSEVIADIFARRPVIAVMPTGAGKSLCYQLPAVVFGERGGITLVVSPLIALMKDQVDALTARGIPAVALTSRDGAEEQREILEGIRAGQYTLVYVAPERLRSPRFADAIRSIAGRIALLAIDEAHCISEWGHDFRPDYRRLGALVKELGAARIAAFTATATPEVRRDIVNQLALEEPRLHVRGFDRPNLHYAVVQVAVSEKAIAIRELVRMRDGGVALIYAATRKNAEQYARDLKAAGMRAGVYHAGLEGKRRERAQDTFMAGELDAIVATNAFGMGVDKSDIRLVVHADMPRSPEAYYQEAGRGGRDGKPTRCVMLFNHGDAKLQQFLIDASYPTAEILRGLWKLLRDRPQLGALAAGGDDDELETRLKRNLGTEASTATIGAAIRILERHGMLRRDDEQLAASRPTDSMAGMYPPLDVEALARRREVEHGKLRTMLELAYYPRCRRQYMLDYFGDQEWASRDRTCGACDTCENQAYGRSASMLSEREERAIKKLLAIVGSLNGRYGRKKVAGIANGTEVDARWIDLPDRGALRGWTEKQIMDLLRVLEGVGLVEASRGEYPTINTTRRGEQVAAGELELGQIGIRMPTAGSGGGGKRKRRG